MLKKQASYRNTLLHLTDDTLEEIKKRLDSKTNKLNIAEIGRAIGRTENKYKIKHYFDINVNLKEQSFVFSRNKKKVKESEWLDGIYVIRTSIPQAEKSTSECLESL